MIEELFASELARHAPHLSTPEIATMTAATLATGAYALQDGKIVPGPPQAIARCTHYLPREFVEALAKAAAAAAPNAAAATIAYVRARGAESFEAALGLSDSRLPPDLANAVRTEVDAQHGPRAAQERNDG